MPHVGRQPRLGCRCSVAQRRVRSDGVVVDAPAFGQHPQLFYRVEDLAVEELISEFRVKALSVAVLPRRTGLDVQRLCSCLASHFRRSLATNSGPLSERRWFRHALHHHHVGQRRDNPGAGPAAFRTHQQALARVFVDQVEKPYAAAVMRPSADEVVAPYMVPPLRPQPHTRSIVEPQTFLVASASAEPSAPRDARYAPRGPYPPASPLAAATP